MAGPQLPFLWPTLFRIQRAALRSYVDTAAAQTTRAPRRAAFASAAYRSQQQPTAQRYGTANEPPAHLGGGKTNKHPDNTKTQTQLDQQPEKDAQAQLSPSAESQNEQNPREARDVKTEPVREDEQKQETKQAEVVDDDIFQPPANIQASTSSSLIPLPHAEAFEPVHDSNNALTRILQMEPPMSDNATSEDKPPHLVTPRYVHHFDTYTLVNSLRDQGGWSEQQSIDIMKAVRGLLASNMDLARDGLVSKGDAEMESYLFRAAVSELRTEIRQRRDAKAQEMSTSRTSLQHEVDILSQRISQDTLSLKDELKGMFDDRKMTVRMERREMENRIQELNYQITTALNSEMRSEVEGLRWVMTRRTVIALAAIVIMSLITLRYAKYAEQQQENERKMLQQRMSREKTGGSNPEEGGGGGGPSSDGTAASLDPASEQVRRRIEAGEDPSMVTMG